MQSFVDFLNGIIWSPALIYLCLGAGVFYSILTRFVQVRHFFEMWRLLLSGKSSSKGISSFQALAVSLSGRVGTGNIAGLLRLSVLVVPALFSGCGLSPSLAQPPLMQNQH